MAVFLAIPSRGMLTAGTAMALLKPGRTPIYSARCHCTSLLALCFNTLWCQALNERFGADGTRNFTHFVMLHDDVEPLDSGWLDTLMLEFEASGADILSCVIPIKDDRGLTSTAVMNPDTLEMTRLTMADAHRMPTTFDGEAFNGNANDVILPNTGLFVCRFDVPWIEEIRFTVRDRIFRDANGKYHAQSYGEDWGLGYDAARLGLKVKATRAINLIHKGTFDFPSMVAWGGWDADKDAPAIFDPSLCNDAVWGASGVRVIEEADDELVERAAAIANRSFSARAEPSPRNVSSLRGSHQALSGVARGH